MSGTRALTPTRRSSPTGPSRRSTPSSSGPFCARSTAAGRYYLETDGGPAHAHAADQPQEPTPEYLDWSRQQIIRAHLAKDEHADYLAVDPQRYQREIDQLAELPDSSPGSLTPAQVVDASFLPKP